MSKYTVGYFIKKFTAIPEEQWLTGLYGDDEGHCALGHCGQRPGCTTTESSALSAIFAEHKKSVVNVNDGMDSDFWGHKGPRARVLAALESFNV